MVPSTSTMKLLSLSLALLSLVPLSSAYFSEGWQPGQPATKYITSSSSAPFAIPTSSDSSKSSEPQEPWTWETIKAKLNVEEILKSKPVTDFLDRFGVNVTKSLETAREGIPPRFSGAIPLITDNNYEAVIFNETFASPQEEADRVWVLLV